MDAVTCCQWDDGTEPHHHADCPWHGWYGPRSAPMPVDGCEICPLLQRIDSLRLERDAAHAEVAELRERVARAIEAEATHHCERFEQSCACCACVAWEESMYAAHIARGTA